MSVLTKMGAVTGLRCRNVLSARDFNVNYKSPTLGVGLHIWFSSLRRLISNISELLDLSGVLFCHFFKTLVRHQYMWCLTVSFHHITNSHKRILYTDVIGLRTLILR